MHDVHNISGSALTTLTSRRWMSRRPGWSTRVATSTRWRSGTATGDTRSREAGTWSSPASFLLAYAREEKTTGVQIQKGEDQLGRCWERTGPGKCGRRRRSRREGGDRGGAPSGGDEGAAGRKKARKAYDEDWGVVAAVIAHIETRQAAPTGAVLAPTTPMLRGAIRALL